MEAIHAYQIIIFDEQGHVVTNVDSEYWYRASIGDVHTMWDAVIQGTILWFAWGRP